MNKTLVEKQHDIVVLKSKLKENEREIRMVEDDLRNKEGFIKVQEVQLKSLKKEFVSAEEKIEEYNNQKVTSELVKYFRGRQLK